MLSCTFFGHRDTPEETALILRKILEELIQTQHVTNFYVGNHGNFDTMVRRCLEELSLCYPICYAVVLAYVPIAKKDTIEDGIERTVLPDGIEYVPPKFGIHYRNKWMIEHSDFVVTYVKCNAGGAATFKRIAERKGKKVINLG